MNGTDWALRTSNRSEITHMGRWIAFNDPFVKHAG